MKKKGYNGHTGLGREKPCKKFGGKRQKILYGALPSQRQRKKFEKFLKKWFEQVKFDFFKNLIHKFRLIEIDRGSKKFLMQFRLIEKQIGSIKILEKQHFRKNNLVFEKTPQSIEYNE